MKVPVFHDSSAFYDESTIKNKMTHLLPTAQRTMLTDFFHWLFIWEIWDVLLKLLVFFLYDDVSVKRLYTDRMRTFHWSGPCGPRRRTTWTPLVYLRATIQQLLTKTVYERWTRLPYEFVDSIFASFIVSMLNIISMGFWPVCDQI